MATLAATSAATHKCSLNIEKDKFVWGLTNSGDNTVKSMYLDLLSDNAKYLKKYIWKMKV
jgi:hypothetical protein